MKNQIKFRYFTVEDFPGMDIVNGGNHFSLCIKAYEAVLTV
jgi:hypothetical protein